MLYILCLHLLFLYLGTSTWNGYHLVVLQVFVKFTVVRSFSKCAIIVGSNLINSYFRVLDLLLLSAMYDSIDLLHFYQLFLKKKSMNFELQNSTIMSN